MMSTCPVCGRKHLIHWPEFWPYRRMDKLFCSEDCLIVHVTQENFSKYKGVRKKMARMKKDGTPAKKPGRKTGTVINGNPEKVLPKVETQETLDGGPVEKIEVPECKILPAVTPENLKKAAETAKEMLEKARKENEKFFGLPSYIDGFEINGISGQFGTYRASSEYNYFEFVPFGGELCMNPGDWHEQIEELNRAAKVLGVKL